LVEGHSLAILNKDPPELFSVAVVDNAGRLNRVQFSQIELGSLRLVSSNKSEAQPDPYPDQNEQHNHRDREPRPQEKGWTTNWFSHDMLGSFNCFHEVSA